MIEIIPTGFFSRDLNIYESNNLVASISDRAFHAYEDSIKIGDRSFSVVRLTGRPDDFILQAGGKKIAIAFRKSGFFYNTYDVEFQDRTISVARRIFSFTGNVSIVESSQKIGQLCRTNPFFRKQVLTTSTPIPLEMAVMIIWSSIAMAKKSLSSSFMDSLH